MKKLILLFFVLIFNDVISALYGDDQALFLTPLIQNKQIDLARRCARVHHSEMSDVISYSGYFTIDPMFNSNTFFWYFPAQEDPENAPVTLWLQGGPGWTSLVALMVENGPFSITEDLTLELREFSWHKNHHLVYFDNPVGVGFSFTESKAGYATNAVEDVGLGVRIALVQFFELFPELQCNEFYITGESYGGIYVPAVAKNIKDYNVNAATKINLKGVVIGDGWSDPINQLNYGDYLYQIGLLDANGRYHFKIVENRIINLIERKQMLDAFHVFDALINGEFTTKPTLFKNLTGFDYNLNYLSTKEYVKLNLISEWAERCDVRKALHVGTRAFNAYNVTTERYLLGDFLLSVATIIEELLEDYRFLVYYGQLDILAAYPMAVNYLQKLNWSGRNDYLNAKRKLWMVEQDLAGYSKTAGNLIEILVRNAGHMVPTDQPKWTFDMITRFTHKQPF